MSEHSNPLDDEGAQTPHTIFAWDWSQLTLALLFALLILSGAALVSTSSLLEDLHLPGRTSADLNQGCCSLEGINGAWSETLEVLNSWRAFAEETLPGAGESLTEPADPAMIAQLWLGIDVLFAIAYVALAMRLTGSRSPLRQEDPWGPGRRVSYATRKAIVLLFITDIAENVLGFVVIGKGTEAIESVGTAAAPLAHRIFRMVTVIKWIFGAIVVVLLAAAIWSFVTRKLTSDRIRHALARSAVPLIAVSAFATALLLPSQTADIVLDWDAKRIALAIFFTILLSAVAWAWATYLLQAVEPGTRQPNVLLFTGLSLAVGLLAWVFDLEGLTIAAGLVLGAGVLSSFAREAPPAEFRDSRSWRIPLVISIVPPLALGLGMFRATVGQAVYTQRILDIFSTPVLWVLSKPAVGSLLVIGSLVFVTARWQLSDRPMAERVVHLPRLPMGLILSAVTLALWLPLTIWIVSEPVSASIAMGVIAIIATAAISFMWLAGTTVFVGQLYVTRFRTPPVFRLFGVSRIPVVTLLVIWMLIALAVDDVSYHDLAIQRDSSASFVADGRTLRSAFFEWRRHNIAPGNQNEDGSPSRSGIPLLLIASEGGGSRAAYWTAGVLECLFGSPNAAGHPDVCAPSERKHTSAFAISSVSGSSVGVASYLVHAAGSKRANESARSFLQADLLSAPIGWFLLVENWRLLLQLDLETDRAEVHEQALIAAWESTGTESPMREPFFASEGVLPLYPIAMFNAASVHDGCIINISHLDIGGFRASSGRPGGCLALTAIDESVRSGIGRLPEDAGPRQRPGSSSGPLAGGQDLLDYMCFKDDLTIATAALASARFPFVSPAGRIKARSCSDAADTSQEVIYVVDGGYIDNSGAVTLMSIWPLISELVDDHNRTQATCIVPFFVQIDNGGENPGAAGPLPGINQLTAPLLADRAAGRGSRANRAKALAAFEFTRPMRFATSGEAEGQFKPEFDYDRDGNRQALGARFVRIFPRRQPAVRVPLGWVLSDTSVDLLERQLATAAAPDGPIDTVRRWLEPGALTCEPVPGSGDGS